MRVLWNRFYPRGEPSHRPEPLAAAIGRFIWVNPRRSGSPSTAWASICHFFVSRRKSRTVSNTASNRLQQLQETSEQPAAQKTRFFLRSPGPRKAGKALSARWLHARIRAPHRSGSGLARGETAPRLALARARRASGTNSPRLVGGAGSHRTNIPGLPCGTRSTAAGPQPVHTIAARLSRAAEAP